ncbi:MAG: hypothetical protein JOS17DRAFT_762637 [Linnemannia elongata]|nr:MAG: hypothetical protein JOS17DRAFT_762637 [Linnemannia elongata]
MGVRMIVCAYVCGLMTKHHSSFVLFYCIGFNFLSNTSEEMGQDPIHSMSLSFLAPLFLHFLLSFGSLHRLAFLSASLFSLGGFPFQNTGLGHGGGAYFST